MEGQVKTDPKKGKKRIKIALWGCLGCSGVLVLFFVLSVVFMMGAATSISASDTKKTPEEIKAEALALEAQRKNDADLARAAEIQRKKEEAEAKEVERLAKLDSRIRFPKLYEEMLLEKGIDAYVSTGGKNHDVLKVKWVLMSRPMVYQISKQEEFNRTMQEMGFRKVVFTDGYNESYNITYDQ